MKRTVLICDRCGEKKFVQAVDHLVLRSLAGGTMELDLCVRCRVWFFKVLGSVVRTTVKRAIGGKVQSNQGDMDARVERLVELVKSGKQRFTELLAATKLSNSQLAGGLRRAAEQKRLRCVGHSRTARWELVPVRKAA